MGLASTPAPAGGARGGAAHGLPAGAEQWRDRRRGARLRAQRGAARGREPPAGADGGAPPDAEVLNFGKPDMIMHRSDQALAIHALKSAAPYIRMYKGKTFVVKAGGGVFGEAQATRLLIEQIALLHHFRL